MLEAQYEKRTSESSRSVITDRQIRQAAKSVALPSTGLAILTAIFAFQGPQGCFPRIQRIVDSLTRPLSRRQVVEWIGRLQNVGLLEVERRTRDNGSQASNRYLPGPVLRSLCMGGGEVACTPSRNHVLRREQEDMNKAASTTTREHATPGPRGRAGDKSPIREEEIERGNIGAAVRGGLRPDLRGVGCEGHVERVSVPGVLRQTWRPSVCRGMERLCGTNPGTRTAPDAAGCPRIVPVADNPPVGLGGDGTQHRDVLVGGGRTGTRSGTSGCVRGACDPTGSPSRVRPVVLLSGDDRPGDERTGRLGSAPALRDAGRPASGLEPRGDAPGGAGAGVHRGKPEVSAGVERGRVGVGGKSSDPLATAIARIEERLRKWPILIDAFRRLAEARAAHEGRWPWPWSLEVMADDLNRCPNLGFALDVLDAALTAGRGGAPVKRLSGCIRTQSHIVARAMIPKREAEWAEMKEQERRMFPRKPDPQAAMDAVYAWGDDE